MQPEPRQTGLESEVHLMRKSRKSLVGRRSFLQNVAAAGAATLVAPKGVVQARPAAAGSRPAPLPPLPESDPAPEVGVLTEGRSGSDFMVDVMKSLGFEYVFANPGSSFRGLHESVINYGGNKDPEFIT